jgi:hypothetical protein
MQCKRCMKCDKVGTACAENSDMSCEDVHAVIGFSGQKAWWLQLSLCNCKSVARCCGCVEWCRKFANGGPGARGQMDDCQVLEVQSSPLVQHLRCVVSEMGAQGIEHRTEWDSVSYIFSATEARS